MFLARLTSAVEQLSFRARCATLRTCSLERWVGSFEKRGVLSRAYSSHSEGKWSEWTIFSVCSGLVGNIFFLSVCWSGHDGGLSPKCWSWSVGGGESNMDVFWDEGVGWNAETARNCCDEVVALDENLGVMMTWL